MVSYFSFPRQAGHNPWLDFLRALAIILVMLRHGQRNLMTKDQMASGPFEALALNGWAGVDLFLILSGYLISVKLIGMRERGERGAVRRYFVDRGLRILPAYYAVLYLILTGWFPFFKLETDDLTGRVFYHIILMQDYFKSDINIVFWSLGVEEKFYLVAPFLIAVLMRLKSARMVWGSLIALMCIAPIARLITYAAIQPDAYLDFFFALRAPFHTILEPLLLGLGLAMLRHRAPHVTLPSRRASALMAASLGTAALLLISHEMIDTITWWDAGPQPLILAGLFAVSAFAALQMSDVRLPFEPGVRVVARLSYVLYLVHYPLMPLAEWVAGDSGAAFWVQYVCLSLTAALILHFAVEKPFLSLRMHVRRSPSRAASVAAA